MRMFHRLTAILLSLLLLCGSVFAEPAASQAEAAEAAPEAREGLVRALAPSHPAAAIGGLEDNLDPDANTTQGEFASLLIQILRTETRKDLSDRENFDPHSEYAPALEKAAALGIWPAAEGNGPLDPNGSMTREEIYVTLARVFGIHSISRQTIYAYTDWREVSDWAAPDLAAMISAGYVTADGKLLNPQGPMTNRDLTALLQKFLNRAGTLVYNNYYCGNIAVAADRLDRQVTVEGSLLLSNEASEMALEELTVTKRLIVQGCGKVVLTLNNCHVHELVVCRDAEIRIEGGQVDVINVCVPTKLVGSAAMANVYANFILETGGAVGTLVGAREGLYMTVAGTVSDAVIHGRDTTVNGQGIIENADLRAANVRLLCQVGSVAQEIPPEIPELVLTRTDSGKATRSQPKLNLGFKLTNLPSGSTEANLRCYVDGKSVLSADRVLITNGYTVTVPYDFTPYLIRKDKTTTVTFYVLSGGKQFTYVGSVDVELPEAERVAMANALMTDAELIAAYHIPDNWARPALLFALRNGILSGKSDGNLAPLDNTTHAELATMLVRILKTETRANLNGYAGINHASWYLEAMEKGVALGLWPIADPNAKTLTPTEKITREEVFVVLARMFGIHGTGRQAIYSFEDWREVSDWAAEDLAAMIKAGYVSGSGNKLNPKGYITRQELAQVLHNLLDRVSTQVYNDSYYGNIAVAAKTLNKGTAITGSLLLSNEEPTVTLENLTVTKRLIIQGNGRVVLNLNNCDIHELVLCRPAEVHILGGSVDVLTVCASTKLVGSVSAAYLHNTFVLETGSTVGTLTVSRDKVSATVAGTVSNAVIYGKDAYINGQGRIENVKVCASGARILCGKGAVTEAIPPEITDLKVTRTDSGKASYSSPKLNLGFKLTNLPTGSTEASLWCYVEGKLAYSADRVLLVNGCTISVPYDFSPYVDGNHRTASVTFYALSGGKQYTYRGEVDVSDSVAEQAGKIRTQNVQAVVYGGAGLYQSMGLTGYIQKIPNGTQVTVLQSREQKYTKVKLPNGNVGWTSFSNVSIINRQYYTTTDYPTPVKEYYVNRVRNCYSNTRYLIWVSLYTQRINIFQGSKGNWKLIRSGPIASGVNYCPTPAQVTTIRYKTSQWNYQVYYCHHVSVFDEARGFHSRPTAYGGGIYNPAIGYPASAGCVRLMDSECIFIWDHVPVGTAVYIY